MLISIGLRIIIPHITTNCEINENKNKLILEKFDYLIYRN